jgi:glycosyltransferase involved in cell wall biosynthesis
MQRPDVTVFMAVYNGEKFISQAIDSVLEQTFKNFELLIIDDGSTDESLSIAKAYNDSRIRILQNENNKGLAFTRNRGVEEAKGEFFATLDCDDIAYKKRLEIQTKFFSENKDVVLCGGRIRFIDQHSKYIGKFSSLNGDQDFLKALLLFNNIYCNSTTMINTGILKKFRYDESFAPAEDYDLFEKISSEYKIGFINEFFCKYRVHTGNVSSIKIANRNAAEKRIVERQLVKYGFSYSQQDLELHTKFTSTEFDFIANHVREYKSWFSKLLKQNAERKIFNKRSFKLALARQWARICFYKMKSQYSLTPFFNKGNLTYPDLLISLIKSM